MNAAFLTALVAGALPEPWSGHLRRLPPDQIAALGGVIAESLRELVDREWDQLYPLEQIVELLCLAAQGTRAERQMLGAQLLALGLSLALLPARPDEDAP